MSDPRPLPLPCPDCEAGVDRRAFLHHLGAAAAVLGTGGLSLAAPTPQSAAETTVKAFYDTLTGEQRKVICFDWDHTDPKRGLLRTHISNFWAITKPFVASDFYTKEQQRLVLDVFKGLFNPDWHQRLLKQLKDDHGGKPFGGGLSAAVFGKPGGSKFLFTLTGRHFTARADGNTAEHVALGGPIFHGHAASGYHEKKGHPGNIFWHQAVAANKLYQVLDGKQQDKALVARRPVEHAVGFRTGAAPGIPLSELSRDQRGGVEEVLRSLVEPYRKEDQDEILECLKKQGGLEKCSLAFYREGDIGDDQEWDNWRLEGPAFVWYFRGQPHVHIWINVADDPTLSLNAQQF
jgi:hypothetical protein